MTTLKNNTSVLSPTVLTAAISTKIKLYFTIFFLFCKPFAPSDSQSFYFQSPGSHLWDSELPWAPHSDLDHGADLRSPSPLCWTRTAKGISWNCSTSREHPHPLMETAEAQQKKIQAAVEKSPSPAPMPSKAFIKTDTAFAIPNICTGENCDHKTPPFLLARYASMAAGAFFGFSTIFLVCFKMQKTH